jgi:Ohr subfamily peroxiredoxin
MSSPYRIPYRAEVTVVGGRNGQAMSSDGRLRVELSYPEPLTGGRKCPRPNSGGGTNPEQLFGAGFAACFLSSIRAEAHDRGVELGADANVTAAVELSGENRLAITLRADLAGFPGGRELVDAAIERCPYAQATRGNVELSVIVE